MARVERDVDLWRSCADTYTIFHASHIADVVRVAKGFEADVQVTVDQGRRRCRFGPPREGDMTLNAKSIFEMLRLRNSLPGTTLTLTAAGPDAKKAVRELGNALEFRTHF